MPPLDVLTTLGQWLSPWARRLPALPEAGAWPALLAQANRQLVFPALKPELAAKGLDGTAHDAWTAVALEAPEAAAYLGSVHAVNDARNAVFVAELQGLVGALNRAGIEPVLLKGAADWVLGVYPAIGARWLADWDLWVPPASLERAQTVLEAERGYRQDAVNPPAAHQHLAPHHRPGTPVVVELHRSLLNPGLGPVAADLEAGARHRPVRLPDGGRAWALAPTDHLAHAFLHAAIAHRADRAHRLDLRRRYAVARLTHHQAEAVDWEALDAWLAGHGLRAAFRRYLLTQGRLFGQPWPLMRPPTASERRYWAVLTRPERLPRPAANGLRVARYLGGLLAPEALAQDGALPGSGGLTRARLARVAGLARRYGLGGRLRRRLLALGLIEPRR